MIKSPVLSGGRRQNGSNNSIVIAPGKKRADAEGGAKPRSSFLGTFFEEKSLESFLNVIARLFILFLKRLTIHTTRKANNNNTL